METPNKILLRSVTRCCTCRRACLPPKSPVECEVALMAWLVRRLRALMVEEPLCAGDLTCRQPQRRSSFERERLSTGDISVQRAQRQQRRSFDLAQQQQRRSFEESLRVQQQRRSSQRSRRSSHGRVSRRTSELSSASGGCPGFAGTVCKANTSPLGRRFARENASPLFCRGGCFGARPQAAHQVARPEAAAADRALPLLSGKRRRDARRRPLRPRAGQRRAPLLGSGQPRVAHAAHSRAPRRSTRLGKDRVGVPPVLRLPALAARGEGVAPPVL